MLVTDAKTTEPFTAAGGQPGMLARDGTDRTYNRTKRKMPEVLEQWQYFPRSSSSRTQHQAGSICRSGASATSSTKATGS